MASALVETSVFIDLLRDYPLTITWYQKQSPATLAINPLIWMEVVKGGPTKLRRLQAARLLKQFEMIYLTDADMDWTMQAQMRYELSHGVGMMDCLITSVSHRLQ